MIREVTVRPGFTDEFVDATVLHSCDCCQLGPAWQWMTFDDFAAMAAGELAEHLTADQLEALLWDHTAFPFGHLDVIHRQLTTALTDPENRP